jgi:taurine dioxygenase
MTNTEMSLTRSDSGAMRIQPPAPGGIGAEVFELDAARMSAELAQTIKSLIYEHKLVVLRGMQLDPAEYVKFASWFGKLEPYHQQNYHHPDHPEIFVSSNVPMNGKKVGVAGTGQFWHTDYSFFADPLSMTFVYPQILPEGNRQTFYIDMERVYRELPEELRQHTVDRRAFHDATNYYKIRPEDIDRPIIELVAKFRAMAPGAWHPVAIRHPVTGANSLYVSEGFTMAIEGLSVTENKSVLAKFFEFIQRKEHIHAHTWQAGDMLLWENRSLIHHASKPEGNQQSRSFRISLFDGLPFYSNPIDREPPPDVYCGDYLASYR